MIEERGAVVAVEDGHAWVETRRRSTCQSCTVSKGCGTGLLAHASKGRSLRVRVLDPLGLQPGDTVVLALAEDALLRGSLAVYLLPLLSLLAGVVLGDRVAMPLGLAADGGALLFGAAGFALGLAWVRRFGNRVRMDRRYQPIVLRRLS